MRRLPAPVLLAVTALLLTPGAASAPEVPGDPTPPVVTPVTVGTLGSNGWYVTNVTASWIVTDPESIILETEGCDTKTLTADTPGTTLTCRAVSDGGETIVSRTIKIDKTAPTLVPDPVPDPNAQGWHRQPLIVKFPGNDAMSGIGNCSPDEPYSGPDTTNAPITGSCSDKAGNTSGPKTYTLKYDATAPTLVPDPEPNPNGNGWHRAPLTVKFPGGDATSGINTCTPDQPYSGPDTTNAPITGSCSDKAGNTSGPKTYTLKYDATAPTLVPNPSRGPDVNGWYNHSLTVSFPGTDATSTIDVCTPPQPYGGPDNANAGVSGSCTDKAGNMTAKTFGFQYDATAPTLVPDPEPNPNSLGWHRQPLTVKFPGSDATSGINACTPDQPYNGPDTTGTDINGSCTDKAGNPSGPKTYTVKYDATAPTLIPDPVPDPNSLGWHRQPLTVKFPGSDATSGLNACTPDDFYDGPDTTNTPITGSCTDKAGNTTGPKTYTLKYDATAPVLVPDPVPDPNANGWHRAPLTVKFPGTDATSQLDVCTPDQAYNGPDTGNAPITGSCTDKAGNTSGPKTYTLKYDATKPQATPSPAPQPNQLGWHKAPLTVTFVGSDATSGPDQPSCTVQGYAGPDTPSHTITGTCKDLAGNTSDQSTYTVKYDATAPTLVADPEPNPNPAGWHRQPLTVKFPGSDVTSGINTCTPDQPYSGPDTTNTSINGTCSDKAGNQSNSTYALKYDATAPTLVPDPDPNPNPAGWHRQALAVKFPGTDATSGINTCTPDQPYNGPDTTSHPITGSCTDKAGNTTGPKTYTVKYDATKPQATPSPAPQPNQLGWHKVPLTVTFVGSDATSGADQPSCTVQGYAGPDTVAHNIAGTCKDLAGNTSDQGTYTVKYDATAPQVTGITPAPDPTGWYTQPVVFGFLGSDGLSGLDSCPSVTYDGPDGADAAVTGACFDKAGNVGTRLFGLKYDDNGPAVTPSAAREPDSNGWYNHSVAVGFTGTDAASGLASCAPPQSYGGPDSVFAVVSGTCTDKAGNVGLGSLALKYDSTAPQVSGATTDRAPDGNGWFNRPLSVRFFGSDAMSDIDSCSVVPYEGPNNPSASVSGSCRDRAGNWSGSNAFAFKYDAVAPSLTKLTVKAGNRSAVLSWEASADTNLVEIVRTAATSSGGVSIYKGAGRSFTDSGLQNGVRYRYTATGYDEAMNAATQDAAATPTAPLSPQAGATVSAPPRLAWRRDEKATYYNVQVWRRGRVFSAWPTGTSIKLTRNWTYNGRRYRLSPGRYRWYVWPGYGARGKKNFGRLIGSSSFIVRR